MEHVRMLCGLGNHKTWVLIRNVFIPLRHGRLRVVFIVCVESKLKLIQEQ